MGTFSTDDYITAKAFAAAKERQHYFTRISKLYGVKGVFWQVQWDFEPL